MKVEKHADHGELKLLLFGDEESSVDGVVTRHVEGCEHCQQRLTEIVSLKETELEASRLLRGFVHSECGLGHSPPSSDPISLQPQPTQHESVMEIDWGLHHIPRCLDVWDAMKLNAG